MFQIPDFVYFGLLWLTAIPHFAFALPLEARASDIDQLSVSNLLRRQNGNPNVAGDLYGLGLRLGAYLQIFGMLLSCIRSQNKSRIGILLLSSSVCLSLFFAWTVLVARHTISPCEAWLILSLSAAYGAPRFCAVNQKEGNKGGIATACCLVSMLWQQISYLAFFATIYRQLPLLGTPNQAWLFAPVDLDGGFRVFMLVVSCIDFIWLFLVGGPVLNIAFDKFVDWSGAGSNSNNAVNRYPWYEKFWVTSLAAVGNGILRLQNTTSFRAIVNFADNKIISRILHRQPVDEIPNTIEALQRALDEKPEVGNWIRIGGTLWGLGVLVLTIAGVEKIIEYNSLAPPTDLSQPGQNIPFILGIITFLVGASEALKPPKTKSTTSIGTAPGSEFEDVTFHASGSKFEHIVNLARKKISVVNLTKREAKEESVTDQGEIMQ